LSGKADIKKCEKRALNYRAIGKDENKMARERAVLVWGAENDFSAIRGLAVE